jgi:hypothetical protein
VSRSATRSTNLARARGPKIETTPQRFGLMWEAEVHCLITRPIGGEKGASRFGAREQTPLHRLWQVPRNPVG